MNLTFFRLQRPLQTVYLQSLEQTYIMPFHLQFYSLRTAVDPEHNVEKALGNVNHTIHEAECYLEASI